MSRFAGQADRLLGSFAPEHATPPAHSASFRIAFICTGNICRSAYAQQTFSALISSSRFSGQIEAFSAGTHALAGQPIDPHPGAIFTREFGQLPTHRAQQLTTELVAQAELLLVMEAQQRQIVLRRYPQALPRTFLLTEYVGICRELAGAISAPGPAGAALSARLGELTARAARHRSLGAEAPDIADPYRHDTAFHEKVAGQIRSQLDLLMSILDSIAQDPS